VKNKSVKKLLLKESRLLTPIVRYSIILLVNLVILLNAQTYISPGIFSDDLLEVLVNQYKTSSTLGYDTARDTMYLIIDNNEGSVSGVYSNFSVDLIPNSDPSTTMYQGGINCEHSWPQSMGAGDEPMRSDLHHLFPCKDNINSSRSNNPYGEIPDDLTDYWFYLESTLYNIPSSEINEYSESYTSGVIDQFEPREDRKGDIARAMFYFKTMYSSFANEEFFIFQKEVLFDWHYYDPVDLRELNRTWDIASYQDSIPNPFIIDPTLVWRAYFFDIYVLGDVNLDQTIDILDVILIVGEILGSSNFTEIQRHQSDFNADFIIDIIDIIILIDIILG